MFSDISVLIHFGTLPELMQNKFASISATDNFKTAKLIQLNISSAVLLVLLYSAATWWGDVDGAASAELDVEP